MFAFLLLFAAPVRAQSMCGNNTIEAPEQCDDGNTNSDDGCSSTCTLEGYIRVMKVTNPNTDTTTEFSFYGNAGGTIKNGEMIDWGWVTPGTYLQGEEDPSASNYMLESIVCNDANSANPSVIDLANREVELNVEGGEHLDCTFTNRSLAPIIPEFGILTGTIASLVSGGLFLLKKRV